MTSRLLRLVLVAAVTAVTVALSVPAFAATATVTGRILLADGSPAAGGVGLDDPDSTGVVWVDLAPDGSFTAEVNQGLSRAFGAVRVPQASDSSFTIEFQTDEFALTPAGQVITLTLPRVATVRTLVVDEDGDPVLDATATRGRNEAAGALDGTTDQGLSLVMGGGSSGIAIPPIAVDAGGVARVPALLGSSGLELAVSAEARAPVHVTVDVPTDPTEVTVTLGDPDPMTVGNVSLPTAVHGQTYSVALTTVGGIDPIEWDLESGSLPHGLSLSPAGVISGTPTTVQATSFRVRATDSSTPVQRASADLTLVVGQSPLRITTASLPAGTVGTAYSVALTGSAGQTPYLWSLAGGSLPAGLTLSADGVISGTPTAFTHSAGLPVVVRLTDSSSAAVSVTKALSVRVDPLPPSVTTETLAPAQVGTPYSQSLQGSGGRTPYSWSVVDGSLPAGLTLDSGVISGTPTTEQAASFRVQLRDASNPAVLATRDLTITVTTVAVTTSTLVDGVVAKAYAATLTASGGKPGYTWSLASGALPAGLTLSATGRISGTPRVVGTSVFTVRAQDTSKPVRKIGTVQLSLTIAPMTIATTTLPTGLVGKSYPWTTLKTLGGKYAWSWTVIAGGLPSGMKLSSGGVISGVPASPGTSTFTVQVTDSSVPKNVATHQFSLTVDPMTITTASLRDGKVNTFYPNQTLKALGGKGTLGWALESGVLPPGLRLSTGGLVSGRPTTAGTYAFVVRVSDSSAPKNIATRAFVITIT